LSTPFALYPSRGWAGIILTESCHPSGNEEWRTTVGEEPANSVQQTSDGSPEKHAQIDHSGGKVDEGSLSIVSDTLDSRQTNSRAQGYLLRLAQHWPLLCLVLISLVMHLAVITYFKTYIQDEAYYVPQANAAIHARGPQLVSDHPSFVGHPSLAILLMTTGILTFGDNPWGWRIPSVIFGIISIVLFYFICDKLAGRRTAFLGSFLLTFENFTFAYSGVAMLDVFFITFMLASFLFFLNRRCVLSGTSLALAGLCKLPGLFGILVILGYWVIARKRSDVGKMGLLLVSTAITFLVLMPVADFAVTGQWFNPIHRVWDMLSAHASVRFSQIPPEERVVSGAGLPWEWLLRTGYGWKAGDRVCSFAYTPTLFLLIVPSVVYMAYDYLRNDRKIALFGLLWFGSTYLLWIAIALVTDRAMYGFYFLPTVGAICMGVGFGVQRVWQGSKKRRRRGSRWLLKALVVSYLTIHVLLFFLVSTLLLAFADVFFDATVS
jgi:dolichyl-phosphate-mannose-protein mannosyltransferase